MFQPQDVTESSINNTVGRTSTLTAQSLDVLLRGTETPAAALDQSWTSSLATPLESNSALKRMDHLNTEERKVLLPSEDALFIETPEERSPQSHFNDSSFSRLSKRLFSPRQCSLIPLDITLSPQQMLFTQPDKLTIFIKPDGIEHSAVIDISKILTVPNLPSLTNHTVVSSGESFDLPHHIISSNEVFDESGISPISPEPRKQKIDENFELTDFIPNSPLTNSDSWDFKPCSQSFFENGYGLLNPQQQTISQESPVTVESEKREERNKSPVLSSCTSRKRWRQLKKSKKIQKESVVLSEVAQNERTDQLFGKHLKMTCRNAESSIKQSMKADDNKQSKDESRCSERLKEDANWSEKNNEHLMKTDNEASKKESKKPEGIKEQSREAENCDSLPIKLDDTIITQESNCNSQVMEETHSTTEFTFDLTRPISPVLMRNRKRKRKVKTCKKQDSEQTILHFDLNLDELDREISRENSKTSCTPSDNNLIKTESESASVTQEIHKNKSLERDINYDAIPLCPPQDISSNLSTRYIDASNKKQIDNLTEHNLNYNRLETIISKFTENVPSIQRPQQKTNFQDIVHSIRQQVVNEQQQNILYDTVPALTVQLSTNELQKSAIDLEKAKFVIYDEAILNTRKSIRPKNELMPFNKMLENDKEEEDNSDVEKLIDLLDADEKLFGLDQQQPKLIPTHFTPNTRSEPSITDLSPISKSSLIPMMSSTPIPGTRSLATSTPLIFKGKLSLTSTKLDTMHSRDNGGDDLTEISQELQPKKLFADGCKSIKSTHEKITKRKSEDISIPSTLLNVENSLNESSINVIESSVKEEGKKVYEETCSIDEDMLQQVDMLEETAIKNMTKLGENRHKIKNDLENSEIDFLLTNFCEVTTINEHQINDVKSTTRTNEEIFPSIENREFEGFKTASGQNVLVSELAMHAAQKVYEEICIETKPPCFVTASGKKIKISDEAFQTAKRQFEDIENDIPVKTTGFSTPLQKTDGFITAGGRKIEISTAALQVAKMKFEEVESDTLVQASYLASPLQKTDSFITTSGREIEISAAALQAAKIKFENTEDKILKHKMSRNNVSLQKSLGFSDFATVSDRKNNICEAALQMSKGKCEKFAGFLTASGKKVNISEAALTEARRKFEVTENEIPVQNYESFPTASEQKGNIFEISIQETEKNFEEAEQKFVGFSTASGKKVNISEAALAEARIKLEEIKNETPVQNYAGFLTASGHKVNVSEAALKAAKRKFEEIKGDVQLEKSTKTTMFSGFSTASGQKVNVSEAALKAAKRKFEETESNDDISETALQATRRNFEETKKEIALQNCAGFSTASGQKINISEAALKAAKKKFKETENDIQLQKSSECAVFSDSSTASSDKVKISQTGFQATKQMSEEMECNDDHLARKQLKFSLDEQIIEVSDYEIQQCSPPEATETLTQNNHSPILKRKNIPFKKRQEFQNARNEQKTAIEAKVNEKRILIPGRFLKIRRSETKLIQLQDLPVNESKFGFKFELCEITSENAINYKFQLSDIMKYDGENIVIPNNRNEVGIDEIESAFLASSGVYPILIPNGGWIKNHYRWIIWKLASLERTFPETLVGYLSIENVLCQLKFRYDYEIDLVQRSPIYKITTKDASPAQAMVLCIAEIHPHYIVLTDTWYCIKTKIDEEMKKLIQKKKIVPGTKLMITGAEIEGNEACLPLEQPSDMFLKIATNSTRRVRWWTKLQFYKCGPLKINFESVLPYGGLIGDMECSVVKIYPIVFAEKTEIRTIVRSEKAEKLESEKAEIHKQKILEKIIVEEKRNIKQQQDKEALNRSKLAAEDRSEGESLCRVLEADPDFHSSLTESQCELAMEWSRDEKDRWAVCLDQKIRERASAECPVRNVSPLLTLRVAGGATASTAIFRIWRPDPELVQTLQDNCKLRIIGAVASGKRSGDICLTCTKTTKIIPLLKTNHMKRCTTPLGAIDEINFKPEFNEVDIVGIVTKIEPVQCNKQYVFLSDSIGYQVVICFWGGIQNHGLTYLLIPGVSIAATNLKWRQNSKLQISSDDTSLPCLYATEFSQFSREPNEDYLKFALQKLRAFLDPELTMKNVKKCLAPATQVEMVQQQSMQSSDIKQKISELAKYGEPPKLPQLHCPINPKLCESFVPPSKIEPDDDSLPMSLSQ